jgi:D-glycero-alpha-D-manno-heptose-7-phosphate kinase
LRIISTTPCRVGLLGGGTDVQPFSSKHSAEILNFAINLRHTCELLPRQDDWVWIEAMGESRIYKLSMLPEVGYDPKFDLIYQTIRSYNLPSGFQLIDKFSGIQGAGLGSSASACVSMIGAFDTWMNVRESRLEIARKAQEMELSLDWISGFQDQIAAVYGGVNYFKGNIFPREVNHLYFIPEFWEDCFVLVFTGRTRHSDEIQQGLVKSMQTEKGTQALMQMKELVHEGFQHLKKGDVQALGNLLDKSWQLKKKSNPEATNGNVDKIYDYAKEHGAIGGKILGAGGDGHILFITAELDKPLLIKRLEEIGVKTIDFSIDYNGLEIRKI